jgi:YD repeat-containing protein
MSYSYDGASELTGIGYQLGQNSLGNLTYAYDLAGRRISMERVARAQGFWFCGCPTLGF